MENDDPQPRSIEAAHRQEQSEARREQTWLELFGVKPPPWEDEAEAPPLDQEGIKRFARNECSKEEFHRIFALTMRFRSWIRAVNEALQDK